MGHGRKPHKARGVCTVKGSAFTTWDAAMAAVVTTPDAVRPYRGRCCGYYHITRMTEDEFAQKVAEHTPVRRVQETWLDDTVDANIVRNLEAKDVRQQEARGGDDGQAPVISSGQARPAPSPATLARRLKARSGAEVTR